MYLSGVTVEYRCDSGYILHPQENNIISCNDFGEWSGTIGNCFPGYLLN